ncbi:MAG TPA: 2Fe-2S iron-sulfur cluster-binding protein [Acetobacteraceae bacterium]
MVLHDAAAGSLNIRPRFHALRVADVRRETADCVSVAFVVPDALASSYRFAPGQYLTLRTRIDGEEVRRSYSICAAPEEAELRVAIKRLDNGAFSEWAHASLRAGMSLDVMTPDGRFGIPAEEQSQRTLVAVAAGSGITPILSILGAALARENGQFFLFYGNRSTASIMFRERLEDLKDRYMARLSVFHVLSREQQDVGLLNGRLDAEKVGLLLDRLVPAPIAHALLCGPQPMIEGLLVPLRTRVGASRVHVERFTPGEGGRAPPLTRAPPNAVPVARAVIVAEGVRREVDVAAGEAVLEAGIRAGLNLPFSCRGGMCCTCRARLVEGTAEMAVNYSLESWEIAAGFILTCQARPTSPRLIVDYDAV